PQAVIDEVRARLHFSQDVPVVALSALRGDGFGPFLDLLDLLAEESSREFATSALNAALEEAVRQRSPSGRHKLPRLYYITQTGIYPPSFLVFTNGASIDAHYRRFLGRRLRQSLGLQWSPVALRFRQRP
ncbi:MAG TPA: ribosome biogenesis GTPase Der, partial [Candidatus Polarisedimenticolia bacterium]|nr:ribosome biogenesis GTPase Der [Candidatus Polarisedimenticolia bacterium]